MHKSLLNKVGAACLHMALSMGALSAMGGTQSYYRTRRGAYSAGKNQYLADPNLRPLSTMAFSKRNTALNSGWVVSQEYPDFHFTKGRKVRELVIVDASVQDKNLIFRQAKPGVDVVEIEAGSTDGILSLIKVLSPYSGLDAVHIVSHARAGVLQIGGQKVDQKSLEENMTAFVAMNHAIREGGDLLLYGCDLAKGIDGNSFLEIISGNTHVDVAASIDKTGNTEYGGNWDLEIQKGNIEASPLSGSVALKDFTGTLQFSGTIDFSQVRNAGDYTIVDPSINAEFWESASKNHVLIVDAATGPSYTFGDYVSFGAYHTETAVVLRFADSETFDPKSIKLLNWAETTCRYTITSDKGGAVTTAVLAPSTGTQTLDISSLPAGTSTLTITSDGAFWGSADNLQVANLEAGGANTAPVASAVSFSGTRRVGETLTGAYTYSDADGDTESGSTFKWYRSDDATGTNKAAIGGAIASTYTLASADEGKYISFEVTPHDGTDAGTVVESGRQGPVAPAGPISENIYDVNHLSEGLLNGQDGWATVNSGTAGSNRSHQVLIPAISVPANSGSGNNAVTGHDGTEAIRFPFGGASVGGRASRVNNATFSFPAFDDAAAVYITEFEMRHVYWGADFGLGYDADGDGDVTGDSEIGIRLTVSNAGNVLVIPGSDPGDKTNPGSFARFNRYQFIIDRGANGGAGSASIWVKDLSGDGEWEPMPGRQQIEMNFGTEVNVSNPATWNAIILGTESDDGGDISLFDNFIFREVKPSTRSLDFGAVAKNSNQSGTITLHTKYLTGTLTADISGTAFTFADGTTTQTGLVNGDELVIKLNTGTYGVKSGALTISGPEMQEPVTTSLLAEVSNTPPVASNVTFTGTLQTGQALTGDYDYSDTESDTESGSVFKWYRSDDASGTNKAAIGGATTPTYTLVSADEGKYISFEVTPNDGIDAGTAVESTKQGPVAEPAPEINLKGNSISIADGDATPSTADHTGFGSVAAASGTISQTFTIENTGDAGLTLVDSDGRGYVTVSGTHAADFSITTSPDNTVASEGSTTFVVQFNPGERGERTASINIHSNDDDENPYTFSIKGTGSNSAPVITSSATEGVNENTAAVLTVTATDADGDTPEFSLSGGDDAALFSINAETGALMFDDAPDFENAVDANTDNVYAVEVTVSDDNGGTDIQSITVTVKDLNESPVVSSASAKDVNENQTSVLTVSASDADAGSSVSFSITGGDDEDLFVIDGSTGALNFDTAPDYETPADADEDNDYIVKVTASDGTNTTAQTITVTVKNVNDNAPAFSSSDKKDVNENATAVLTVTSSDADETGSIAYSITGGADEELFSINASTGALSFSSAPDFEDPKDANTDNDYIVKVTVTDGTNSTEQTITVSVKDVNDNAPVFTSAASKDINENTTTVLTVAASDADISGSISYSIAGGADQAKFSIDASTGALSFSSAPDFEDPKDANTDNDYVVQVAASDGTFTTNQTVTVSVDDRNDESPVITAAGVANTDENETAVITVTATDADAGSAISFSITGGDDQGLFGINSSTGVLTFNTAPDYETPADANAGNDYIVKVSASDGTNVSDQTITVSVQNVNDNTPVINDVSFTVDENEMNGNTAGTQAATDADGDALTYSITAGNTGEAFAIDHSGKITVSDKTLLDYETHRSFTLTIKVTDGTRSDQATITINLNDLNDNTPAITSHAPVSIDEDVAYSYNIAAEDADANDALTITAITLPSWLTLTDNGNGTATLSGTPNNDQVGDHTVNLKVEDEANASDEEIFTITVANVNDAPEFTSAAIMVATEETAYSYNITAKDVDTGDAVTITAEGKPSWLTFTDNGDGTATLTGTPANTAVGNHAVSLKVKDASNASSIQNFTLIVNNRNDAPVFTSIAPVEIKEDTFYSYSILAEDTDAGEPLAITATTLPSWLTLTDHGDGTATLAGTPANDDVGVHDVTLEVADGAAASDTQHFSISVSNVNDAPQVRIALSDQHAHKNQAFQYSIPQGSFEDADAGDALTFTVQLANGYALPAWLSFDPVTQAFSGTPSLADQAVLIIAVTASDNKLVSVTDEFALEVSDPNHAPVDILLSAVDVEENHPAGTYIGSFTTEDQDAHNVYTYRLVSGEGSTGNAFFYIDGDGLYTHSNFDAEVKATYSIRVETNDGDDGILEKVFHIHVKDVEDARVYIPNLFSPNSDGSNDTFRVRANGVEKIVFRIFNRWGEMVYQTSNVQQATEFGWDGNYKGKEQPSGSYVWQLSGTFSDGTSINYEGKNTGNITLIR